MSRRFGVFARLEHRASGYQPEKHHVRLARDDQARRLLDRIRPWAERDVGTAWSDGLSSWDRVRGLDRYTVLQPD